MTNELYSRFQRTLGVIEGISLGLNNEIGNALLEQCDVLDSIIELTQRYDGKDDRGGNDDVERG